MAKLKREIKDMKTGRDTKRSSRKAHGVPSVAIAGYTNAGKSSLLNRLTGAGVLVENQLFATLDPTVRRAETADGPALHARRHRRLRARPAHPAGRGVPLDAGGGRPTPTCCCTSSTARTPTPRGRSPRSAAVLAEVGGDQLKEIIVVNKADAADPEVLDRLERNEKHCVVVSARTGQGLDAAAGPHRRGAAAAGHRRSTVLLPYDRGDLVSRLHQEAEVLSSEHTEHGTRVEAKVDRHLVGDLEAFAV